MNGKVIDADGHVIEDPSFFDYLTGPFPKGDYRMTWERVFPSLDFHHVGGHVLKNPKAFGGGKPVGPADWLEMIDKANIEQAVLYPTKGLRIGNISHPDWACIVARAYNDWLYNTYLKKDSRFKGVALIPLQDIEEATSELRRTVVELGMVGGMLPSRGLPLDLGHKTYWPLYAEAAQLNCVLAVHGGAHHGMGLDTFETFVPIQALGHPLSLIIAFTGMVYHGTLDRFPDLRIGFMEGAQAGQAFGWTVWIGRTII